MTTIRDTFARGDWPVLAYADSGEAWEQTFAVAPGILGIVGEKATTTTSGGAALTDFAVGGIPLESAARTVSVTIGQTVQDTIGALGVTTDPLAFEGIIVLVIRSVLTDPSLVQVLEQVAGVPLVRAQQLTDGPYDEVTIEAAIHDGQLYVTATGGVSIGPIGVLAEQGGYVGIGAAGGTFGDGVTFDNFEAVGLDVELVGDGPCQAWTTVADVQSCDGCSALSDTAVASAIAVASEVLYNMSKRRFPGICSDTVRPQSCGCHHDHCTCPGLSEITLGGWPIVAVSEVLIDGVALATSAYRVDNGTTLVRLDGEAWPTRQDLELADTEPDTWSVSYTYGRAVPSGGLLSAKLYACEIAKLCDGGECKLPAKVQTISRQGVTAGFVDLGDIVEMAGIGIPYVDTWLASLDHAQQGRGLIIASPDTPRSIRRTGA